MTSAVNSNASPFFSDLQTQRFVSEVPKLAEDAKAPPLLELDPATGEPKALAALHRTMQLSELGGLMAKKRALERNAELDKWRIATYEKALATPPQPPTELTGQDAAAVVQLAKRRAAEVGHPFAPTKDDPFSFVSGEWFYTVHGDGRVTRRDKNVLTPEQWESKARDLQRAKDYQNSGARETEISEIDQTIASLQDKMGGLTAEELSKITSELRPIVTLDI